MIKPLFLAERLRPSRSNFKVQELVLSDMCQKLFFYVFSNKTVPFFAKLEGSAVERGALKLPQLPTPPSYGGLETGFLKGFIKYCFLYRYFSLFICACAFVRKKTLASCGLRTIVIRNSYILFFKRSSNFCLRLDAQNFDIHTRLSLLLICSYNLIFFPSFSENTCEGVVYLGKPWLPIF